MQKHVNLVDLVKSFPTNIYLQNLASIQKRTSPIKFAHLAEKSEKGSISNLSTKAAAAEPAPETRRADRGSQKGRAGSLRAASRRSARKRPRQRAADDAHRVTQRTYRPGVHKTFLAHRVLKISNIGIWNAQHFYLLRRCGILKDVLR